MKELVLGIGGNLGNRLENLEKLRVLIDQRIGKIIKLSSIYESEPWGFESVNWFLNQVVVVDSALKPLEVLKIIHTIEEALGRIRTGVYSNRLVDVDILFFGELIFKNSVLQIPHAHISERNFVLQALNEISPDFIHPLLKLSCKDLLRECEDKSECRIFF